MQEACRQPSDQRILSQLTRCNLGGEDQDWSACLDLFRGCEVLAALFTFLDAGWAGLLGGSGRFSGLGFGQLKIAAKNANWA